MSVGELSSGRDPLTGLATLRDFLGREEAVDAECRSCPPAAYGIVLVDVVGLVAVNHERGFEAGDELLRQLADRLVRVLVNPPPLCLGRVGGDDFAVLVKDVAQHRALSQLARRIRMDVAGRPFLVLEQMVPVELRTTFRYGPNAKPHKSDLLWDVQRADHMEVVRELHHRLEALERRQGVVTGDAEDLRQRLAAAERRAHLGEFDELTGLRNRRGMNEALAKLTGPRVVAFVDLDNLRELNSLDENWAAGDKALAGVGRLLSTFGLGSVAGRFGGDEFALVVPGRDLEAVRHELSELNTAVSGQLQFGGVRVSFSAGVACAESQQDHEAAQSAAQAKAREAKRSGRGQVL